MLTDEDEEFLIYAAGPANINSMSLEFSNISERSLKSRGIRIRTYKVPPRWIKDNIAIFDYFAFFSKPKEPVSELAEFAEAKSVELAIYRY